MNTKFIETSIFYLFLFLPVSLLFGTLLSELSIILICAFFIYYSFKIKNFNWIKSEDFKVLLILYILLIINLIFADDKNLSFLRNFGFIKYIIFIFAVKKIILEKIEFIDKIFTFWLLVLLVVISDLYYENFTGANILGYSINTSRLVGFLGDEVKIGTFILGFLFPTAIYWFYRLFYSKKNNKLIYLNKFIYFLLIIFTLYILLPIGQRSVVVKLFFSLVFLFFFFPSISFKKKILSFFSFLFLFLIIIWNVNSLKSRYINQIFLSKSISSTLQPLATTNESQKEKINIIKIYKNSSYWKHHYASFEVFKSSPIFGVGNKNFRNSCHKYTEIVNKISFNNHHNSCSTHPHQIYYEFLSEHGVFGIFFIIILMSFYFKKFYYFKKNNNIFILGAITYFVYSFLPLIPSGSFFTSFNATLFWLNFCFLYFKTDRYN